ncbi:unnamed protein product [Orchesella dallaii]|uniref:Uncharacterized protein n=1 Tax=Orchesella dallaii TaxID=48710 RepID=A0ABP1R1D5_9HEXA
MNLRFFIYFHSGSPITIVEADEEPLDVFVTRDVSVGHLDIPEPPSLTDIKCPEKIVFQQKSRYCIHFHSFIRPRTIEWSASSSEGESENDWFSIAGKEGEPDSETEADEEPWTQVYADGAMDLKDLPYRHHERKISVAKDLEDNVRPICTKLHTAELPFVWFNMLRLWEAKTLCVLRPCAPSAAILESEDEVESTGSIKVSHLSFSMIIKGF